MTQQPSEMFEVAWDGPVAVLTLLAHGRPDADNRAARLREKLIKFLDEHRPANVLIDFAGFSKIGDTHLGHPLIVAALLAAKKRTDEYHARWKLCGLPDELRERYLLARLDKLFALHETRSDAIAAFTM